MKTERGTSPSILGRCNSHHAKPDGTLASGGWSKRKRYSDFQIGPTGLKPLQQAAGTATGIKMHDLVNGSLESYLIFPIGGSPVGESVVETPSEHSSM
jgi:hypothetical protein